MGHESTSFIDDSCLTSDSYGECKQNIKDTVELFEKLGFVVRSEKSVFEPSKRVRYLGFWFDSSNMTVTMTDEKKDKVKREYSKLKKFKRFTIRSLAQVIAMVSLFPAFKESSVDSFILESWND